MKTSRISKLVGASILSLSLGILPSALPASAQNNDPGTTIDNNTNAPGERVAGEAGDRDFDWGWLGLLGLLGLAGLKGGSKHKNSAQYSTSAPNNAESRAGYR